MDFYVRLARAVIYQALRDLTHPTSKIGRDRAYAWLTNDSADLRWWSELSGLRFRPERLREHPAEYYATVRVRTDAEAAPCHGEQDEPIAA